MKAKMCQVSQESVDSELQENCKFLCYSSEKRIRKVLHQKSSSVMTVNGRSGLHQS